MPDYRFTSRIEVRYGDLDPQGHLNNAKYFTYMEQARFHYLAVVGLWTPAQGYEALGQIVAKAECTYLRPVFLGEIVEVSVRTARLGTKSIDMEYQLTVAGEAVATGRTLQVAYDYTARQSIPVPPDWRDRIAAFEGRTF